MQMWLSEVIVESRCDVRSVIESTATDLNRHVAPANLDGLQASSVQREHFLRKQEAQGDRENALTKYCVLNNIGFALNLDLGGLFLPFFSCSS